MKNLCYAGVGVVILVAVWLSIFIGITAILAWAFQGLWNWAIVDAFKITTLTYKQSFGIILILMLVGSALKSVTVNSK